MTTINIYIRLNGAYKERFLKIKENMGLKSNSEVLRHIITDYYKKHFQSDEEERREAAEA